MLFQQRLEIDPLEHAVDEGKSADRPRSQRLIAGPGAMASIVLVGDRVRVLFRLFVIHAVICTAWWSICKCPVGRKNRLILTYVTRH